MLYLLLKSYGKSLHRDRPPVAGTGEDMVRCAHCGVHLPKSESVLSDGEFFCSDEHRRLHRE